jgi:hypothetical protein
MRAFVTAVVIGTGLTVLPVAAREIDTRYECRFPGQPRTIMFFGVSFDSYEIQFGSEPRQKLEDHASVGTGMRGHVYATERKGKLLAYVVGAGPRAQARLRIWPSREAYEGPPAAEGRILRDCRHEPVCVQRGRKEAEAERTKWRRTWPKWIHGTCKLIPATPSAERAT